MPEVINPENFWLVKRIESLNSDLFTGRIEFWDEGRFTVLKPFVKELYWNGQATVNIFRIKGTQHPDYAGLTWLEFLKKGKRMPLNLALFDSNPAYYLECLEKSPRMFFQGLDGGYLYVGGDGNHRTAIARAFFFIEGRNALHGVDLTDYRIDWEMWHMYELVREIIAERGLSYIVEPYKRTIHRVDSGSWMEEKYEITVKVTERPSGKTRTLDRTALKLFIEELKSLRKRRFFSLGQLIR